MQGMPVSQDFARAVAGVIADHNLLCNEILAKTLPDFKGRVIDLNAALNVYRDYVDACNQGMETVEGQTGDMPMAGRCIDQIDWEHHCRPNLAASFDAFLKLETVLDYLAAASVSSTAIAQSSLDPEIRSAARHIQADMAASQVRLRAWRRCSINLLDTAERFAAWQSDVLMADADGAYGAFTCPAEGSAIAEILVQRAKGLRDITVGLAESNTACRRLQASLQSFNGSLRWFVARGDAIVGHYRDTGPKAA